MGFARFGIFEGNEDTPRVVRTTDAQFESLIGLVRTFVENVPAPALDGAARALRARFGQLAAASLTEDASWWDHVLSQLIVHTAHDVHEKLRALFSRTDILAGAQP